MKLEKHDDLNQAFADLMKRSKVTSDIRFQAALRLTKRQKASTYVISVLSLYVIALSLIPNIFNVQNYQNQILLSGSIVLSAFIIFSSIMEGNQNFIHQSEVLRDCARKIERVYLESKLIDIEANRDAAQERFNDLSNRYQEALDGCSINHDPFEYNLYKAKINLNSKIKIRICRLSTNKKFRCFYYICAKSVIFAKRWMNVKFLQMMFFAWILPYCLAISGISFVVYRYVLLGTSWVK